MDINSINGKLIRDARKHKNMTQEELASKLHVTKQAVSAWENGRNRPDEDLRGSLEEILGISLQYMIRTKQEDSMTVKPLSEIKELEEVLETVKRLVNAVEVDSPFQITIHKQLEMLLILVIGYYCYYIALFHPHFGGDPIDWGDVAFDLRECVSSEPSTDEDTSFPYRFPNDLMKKKIEWMSFEIGGELFEDFDDNGFRHGFPQQIGRMAESCGYDLLSVLPGKDSSLMSVFKTAVLSLADSIQEC